MFNLDNNKLVVNKFYPYLKKICELLFGGTLIKNMSLCFFDIKLNLACSENIFLSKYKQNLKNHLS